MKSAKEILKDNGVGLLASPYLIKAMKVYAEQAIDRCAETANTYAYDLPNKDDLQYAVDKQSILKVKQELT